MLARFAETITSWASRGKKLLWGPAKARYASYRTGAGEDVSEVAPDDAAHGAGDATGDHKTTDEGQGVGVSSASTPEDAEPGNDPLEDIRSELHDGVDTDTAFSLGLLHDVGKLVLFHHISDLRRARRREITLSEKFLTLALASLHEPLGGLAVLEWDLDEKPRNLFPASRTAGLPFTWKH